MYRTKDAVKIILEKSEIALTAFNEGYLNFSAYAKKIKPEVEKETKKNVSVGSIVVSLSRIKSESKGKKYVVPKDLLPLIKLNDIVVKSSLFEITFENTEKNRSVINEIQKKSDISVDDMHMISIGINEITLILPIKFKEKTIKLFAPAKPKIILDNLAAVTVRFSDDYLYIPNTIFVIIRELALRRINIIEIVSTFTELSIIVTQKELMSTFEVLNGMTS